MEIDPLSDRSCVLRASLDGYDSTVIDVSGFNWSTDPNLPPLVLRRREAGSSDQSANIFYEDGVPLAARTAWNNAQKLAQKKNWRAAERELRTAVQAAPKFTQGWYALGIACSNQNKPAEARDAFLRVVELDPKSLDAYLAAGAREYRGQGLERGREDRRGPDQGRTPSSAIRRSTCTRQPRAIT